MQDSQPVGAVMLLKYDVESTPELRAHSFVISKHGAPSHYLAADSDEAALRWTTAIREAVERNNQVDPNCLDINSINLSDRNILKNSFVFLLYIFFSRIFNFIIRLTHGWILH